MLAAPHFKVDYLEGWDEVKPAAEQQHVLCAFRSNLFFQGQGENCPKEERWRSQIESARVFLERSSTLLLISSKTFQRHPQCPNARENRDTVFCQMRRALDLIHYIIKEGVMDCTSKFGLDGVSGSITASLLTACDGQVRPYFSLKFYH